MNISKINLPKGNDGRFILTKDAINILRKAQKITVSFNKDIKSECYIMAEITTKVSGIDFDAIWIMPINTLEHHLRFKCSVVNHSKSPFQMLIKNECSVTFIPMSSDGLDKIRFLIHIGSKTINGLFEIKPHIGNYARDMVSEA